MNAVSSKAPCSICYDYAMNFIPGQEKSSLLHIIIKLLGWGSHKFRKSIASDNLVDAPIIASYGLNAAGSLLGAAKGKLAGYDFVLIGNAADRAMLIVTLPKNTGLHIIALGDKTDSLGLNIQQTQRQWLEPVSLEGLFPERFDMFVSKDRQMEVRQLFEPDVIMHFYELCRTYDFELFHESIYFSVARGAHDSGDDTSMVADAEAFLIENAQFFNGLPGQRPTASGVAEAINK